MSQILVDVTHTPLCSEQALAHCHAADHGAVDLFIGRVRNINQGREVLAVSYELHAPLCRNVFAGICDEALQQWGGGLRLCLVHRHGRLGLGEASVIAAASSRHRDEAFRACRYLVEQMKHRAPIWKQEHYIDGDSEWLEGHALCGHD